MPDGVAANAVGLARAQEEDLLSTRSKVQAGSIAKTVIEAKCLTIIVIFIEKLMVRITQLWYWLMLLR